MSDAINAHLNATSEYEQYLQAILKTSNDGFWVVDAASQQLLDVNDMYSRMSGYTRDELLKLRISDIDAVENPESTSLRITRIIENQGETFETCHRRKDGSLFDVELSVSYLSMRSGRFLCFCRDITERKRTLQSLQVSEKLLRNIIDSSADYIYVKDRNLRTLLCNKTFAEALGKEPVDLVGKTDIENGWNPLFVKGDSTKGIRGFEPDDLKALSGEIVHVVDEPGNVSDTVRIFDTIKLPLYQENGDIFGVLGISRDITDRTRAERALRETKERMQFALEASLIGTWDLDLVDHSAFRTIEHDRIFGYEELLPQWTYEIFLEHVHSEDRIMVDSAFQTAIRTRGNWDFECRIIRRDGELRWIRACGQHRHDGNNSCRRMAGIVQDITSRKCAEQQREQGLALLTNLARLVPGVIYQYRLYPDGRSAFPYASPGMVDIYGVTPEEVQEDATPVFGRLHPDDLDRVAEDIFRSARTLETFYCDFRVILPGIGLRWRWSQAHPERTADGGTLWHGIITDVTERKLAEQAIAAEKERLAVTLRSIGDGVITTDTQGCIDSMNKVAEQLTGWLQHEAYGKPLTEIFTIINEETRLPCEDLVMRILTTGQTIELASHTVLIARDGIERAIADSGAPIRNSQNEIIGVVLVFRDITEKQKLLNTIQRTAKLESLSILAGGIAHDFNNLLGGIYGFIEMARESAEKETASDLLSKAFDTIGRARALTLQLLTFAKGGAPVKKVEELFPFVEETARFALSGSPVSCKVQTPDDLWLCEFDKNQIGQVIDNLVINAQQSMPTGGIVTITAANVTITESQHPALSAGNYVKVSIADMGTGIPAEIIPRIFDPFFTTKPKGNGLGLATCYSILQRHDGYIDVESETGKGSSFHFYLPASLQSVETGSDEKERTHRGSGTVLVMDDEEVMREVICVMLQSMGYSTLTAENGTEAIEIFSAELKANRKIKAMIFDLTIPGAMGGKEAIGVLRQICPRTPVFVSSGYAEDPIMSEPDKYGFTASIRKPFRRVELMEMLEKNLKTIY